jgi:hypothetical protein
LARLNDETLTLDSFNDSNDTYTYDVSITYETSSGLSDTVEGTVNLEAKSTGTTDDGEDEQPSEDPETSYLSVRNASTNVSDDMISSGGSIELSAEANSSETISNVTLATNESGAMSNVSNKSSGFTDTDGDGFIETSFTWSNDSISSDTVEWKITFQTSTTTNSTSTLRFTIKTQNTMITSFENNLEDFDVSSDAADNPKNSLQNSLISDSTDRGTALNLSEDGAGPSPATFLVGDSENFTNTIREGDIVKYDVKPKTEENTGLTGLFNNNDANFALGQPSNTIVTYIDLDESDTSSSEFKIWGLNSGNEVEYSSRDSNVDLNPDKYYTVRVDYNSEETPEQVYKAELYNSTSLKSSVNITVPDSFIDENHDDFAIIKFNQESSPKYSYFDKLRKLN